MHTLVDLLEKLRLDPRIPQDSPEQIGQRDRCRIRARDNQVPRLCRNSDIVQRALRRIREERLAASSLFFGLAVFGDGALAVGF